MFASFDGYSGSSMDAGCSSCSTIDDAFNVMPTSNQMSNPHAVQMQQQQPAMSYQANTVIANHANSVMPGSVVQPQQVVMQQQQQMRPAVQNVATMMSAPQQPTVQVVNTPGPVTNAQAAMNKMVSNATGKQVVVSEGFQNMQPGVQVNIPGRLIIINIGFIILAALATNEAAKYYLNKALQTAEGSVHYYLFYAIIAVCVVVGVHWYTKRFMAA